MAEVAGSDATADVLAGVLGVLPGERDEQPAAALTKTHPTATATRVELTIPGPRLIVQTYYKSVSCFRLSEKYVKWPNAKPSVCRGRPVIAAAGRHRSGCGRSASRSISVRRNACARRGADTSQPYARYGRSYGC